MDYKGQIKALFLLIIFFSVSTLSTGQSSVYSFDSNLKDTISISSVIVPKNFSSLKGLKLDRFPNLIEVQISYQDDWNLTVIELQKISNLESLSIIDAQLFQLPPQLDTLTRLKRLEIVDNEISIITSNIEKLIGLEELILTKNRIDSCEVDFGKLTKLVKIDISNNSISSIKVSKSLPNLENLKVSSNQIEELPSKLFTGEKIKTFKASRNNLSYIPEQLWNNNSIEILQLKDNKIGKISERINDCKELTYLNISNNPISFLPPTFDLPRLEKLKLGSIETDFIPDVHSLISLKEIDISDNGIAELPIGLSSLENLEKLDISFNEIRDITPVMDLCHLKKFMAIKNNISNISFRNSCLQELELLGLNSNQIQEIDLTTLISLKELELRDNSITEIVVDNSLSSLIDVDLGRNELDEIPSVLVTIPNLQKLDVSYNDIDRLDEQIFYIDSIVQLECQSCGLKEIPSLNQKTNLKNLVLGGNELERVDLSNYSNLEEIELSKNPIVDIVYSDFYNLKYLDLSKTLITEEQLLIFEEFFPEKIIFEVDDPDPEPEETE